MEIGKNCNIQAHVTISNGVIIGDGCFIGPGVNILNDKYINGLIQPPKIGNYVRIGGNTTIFPGVIIFDNALIGAASVITKNVPNGEVVKGKW